MGSKYKEKPKNRLLELRGREEVTQTEIARIVSSEVDVVSQKAVSRWENHTTGLPVIAAVRIALYFNVSLDWLLCLTDDEAPAPPSKEYAGYLEAMRPDVELE